MNAQDIYQRFCEIPLRLKPLETTAETDEAPETTVAQDVAQNDDQNTLDDVSALQGGQTAGTDDATAATSPMPSTDSEGSAGESSSKVVPAKNSRKIKRYGRATQQAGGGSVATAVDTPTKPTKPAKRGRKTEQSKTAPDNTAKVNDVDVSATDNKENNGSVAKYISFGSLVTDGDDKDGVLAASKNIGSTTSRGRRCRVSVSEFQKEMLQWSRNLLQTKTIAGAFFAIWATELLSEFKGKVTAFYGSVFEPLLMLCFEVAECESKTYAASLQSRPRPRKKPTARSAKKQSKKTVRFRSFDMSCLNLQYVEDDRSAAVVDNVLQHYDEIMEQARAVVQFAADSTNDELLKKSLELMDKCCEEKDRDADSTQIFLEAFARADTHLQHEIKVCGHYYATELTSMLSSHSTTRKDDSAPFLVQMFSGLLSSAVRYKLRVIFLPLDPNRVSEEPSEDQNDELCRPDHPYNHQDLGAAVHRALEELHTFEVAKNSVLQLAEGRELESFSSEDMDVVVQYSSAVRFLHFYLTQSLSTLHMEDGNDETWAEVRSLCSMAQRYHFDDEAHLFPLASTAQLLQRLSDEMQQLDVLQSTLTKTYPGLAKLVKEQQQQQESCFECGNCIDGADQDASIICCECTKHYHLSCLHLPESFAQFAGQYTCPMCFLGVGQQP